MIALSKPASFTLFNFSSNTRALYHLAIRRAGKVPNTLAEMHAFTHVYTVVVNTHRCAEMINEVPFDLVTQALSVSAF